MPGVVYADQPEALCHLPSEPAALTWIEMRKTLDAPLFMMPFWHFKAFYSSLSTETKNIREMLDASFCPTVT